MKGLVDAGGKYAKPRLLLRRWLSDRAFDSIVMSRGKRMA